MLTLNLGVIDIPYSADSGSSVTTTGDVAQFLEAEYHVMEVFAIEHQDEIAGYLAESIADQIRDVMSGAPVPANPFADAELKIKLAFDRFIETEEIARINPDTPTQAALDGRSKRRKGATGPRRVSFRDTGQYVVAFQAWVERDGAP